MPGTCSKTCVRGGTPSTAITARPPLSWPVTTRRIDAGTAGTFLVFSDAKIGLLDLGVLEQRLRRAGGDYSALLDHVRVMGKLKCLGDVLLDEKHCDALLIDLRDDPEHVVHDGRR